MAYKIHLSNKSSIQIDREELETVTNAIQSGVKFFKIKSGIINPSYIVCIEPDYDRLNKRGLDELPDMFKRIGTMKKISEMLPEKVETVDPKKIAAWLEKKPKI